MCCFFWSRTLLNQSIDVWGECFTRYCIIWFSDDGADLGEKLLKSQSKPLTGWNVSVKGEFYPPPPHHLYFVQTFIPKRGFWTPPPRTPLPPGLQCRLRLVNVAMLKRETSHRTHSWPVGTSRSRFLFVLSRRLQASFRWEINCQSLSASLCLRAAGLVTLLLSPRRFQGNPLGISLFLFLTSIFYIYIYLKSSFRKNTHTHRDTQ